jgi:hypothetical protein
MHWIVILGSADHHSRIFPTIPSIVSQPNVAVHD